MTSSKGDPVCGATKFKVLGSSENSQVSGENQHANLSPVSQRCIQNRYRQYSKRAAAKHIVLSRKSHELQKEIILRQHLKNSPYANSNASNNCSIFVSSFVNMETV